MNIQMTPEEFKELRKIVVKVNNPKLTKKFNAIFDPKNNNIRGIKATIVKEIPLSNQPTDTPKLKEISISISSKMIVIPIFQKIGMHSNELNKFIDNGPSIIQMPKLVSLFHDILNIFK